MAECLESVLQAKADWKGNEANFEEQNNEVEALKSFYENTDNFDVYEAASIEDGQLFSLQFKIKMEKQGSLAIELWIPIETSKIYNVNQDDSESATTSKDACTVAKEDQPTFERSLSGKQAHTVIRCEYLPEIRLDVVLPVDYPSHNRPRYTLTCIWLSKSQLLQACEKLDEMWRENLNMPVLYTWIDWLQTNLIGFLDIFEKPNNIIITPLNNFDLDTEEKKSDERAVSSYVDSDNFIYEFLRYNHVEELKAFRNSMQNCLICFDEKQGSEFFRLHKCKHHFCGDCMTSMCQMHVKDGTIQFLKCPENKCDEVVPIDIMQEVLTSEEFDRWERLLFQRTLDSMEDIMYCPKCQNPITIEKSNTHAYCMYCRLDYCKECKDPWHPGGCVTGEQKINAKLKHFNLDAKKLLLMSDEEIKQYFKNPGAILGLKLKAQETTNLSELEILLKRYLRCPKCKAYIEKIDGCNKMSCICGIFICYVCGRQINGYEHFNENPSCSLWAQTTPGARIMARPEHEGQRAVNRVLDLVPEQKKNLVNCPSCGQRCLKQERNNHIKCWLCATNFCFCCKKRIVGIITNHYRFGTACKQHSD